LDFDLKQNKIINNMTYRKMTKTTIQRPGAWRG
jgi:hypothetical protein